MSSVRWASSTVAIGGFMGGAGNAWLGGASFGQGLKAGAISGSISGAAGGVMGGVMGGLVQGLSAASSDANFWDGGFSTRTLNQTLSGRADPAQKASYEAMARNYDANYTAELNDEVLNDKVPNKGYASGGLTTKVELYDKYGMDLNKRYVNFENWTYSAGFTNRGGGNPRVHISPFILEGDPVAFRATVGHELIHAYHFSTISRSNFNVGYSERVAYRYTSNVYLKAGHINQAISWMNKAMSYNALGMPRYYNYSPPLF